MTTHNHTIPQEQVSSEWHLPSSSALFGCQLL